MKNLGNLLIPLGVGTLAFVLNWMAVQPQLGRDFVTVNEDAPLDKPLDESQLTPFKIVGSDFDTLRKTLVPWEERAAVLGLPVRRDLRNGDFVFWQDVRYLSADFLPGPDEIALHVSLEGVDYEPSLLKVGNQIGLVVPLTAQQSEASLSNPATVPVELSSRFEEVGPFRILSVGGRTLEQPGETEQEDRDRGNTNFVTLAVKLDPGMAPTSDTTPTTARPVPEAARKLLAARNARQSDGKPFVAMVLYQDVDKLRRLRDAQIAKSAAAVSASTTAASSETAH